MPGEGQPFTPETASEAGKKSKRKPLDTMLAELFENFIAEKVKEGSDKDRTVLMFEAAYKEFILGNHKPLAYLMDRGFGKAKNRQNPLFFPKSVFFCFYLKKA